MGNVAKYRISIDDIQQGLTVGETRDLARIGNLTVGEMQAIERGDMANLPMSAMIAVVYILIRRQHPRFSEAEMNDLSWDDIDFAQPKGNDGTADPSLPLPPLKSGGRKSSARSVATTA
jgi:hypothetical protein